MSEFKDDTLIHVVVSAKQWDEMWELYQANNKTEE